MYGIEEEKLAEHSLEAQGNPFTSGCIDSGLKKICWIVPIRKKLFKKKYIF